MEERDYPAQQYIKIPQELYNSDTGLPFSHCMICDHYLLDDGTPYLIEKAFRKFPEMNVKEVIFEYAMCLTCTVKMNSSLSDESRQRINRYFMDNTNLLSRRQKLLTEDSLSLDTWTSECVIKKTAIENSNEYQVVVQCDGKHIVFTDLPFALSMEAIEEMSSLLSAKSRGEIDDFIGKYFTGPPEVSEILKKRVIFI